MGINNNESVVNLYLILFQDDKDIREDECKIHIDLTNTGLYRDSDLCQWLPNMRVGHSCRMLNMFNKLRPWSNS